MRSHTRTLLIPALAVVLAGACSPGPEGGDRAAIEAEVQRRVERALEEARGRIALRADSMDEALQPVPLLTGAEEASLRRYLNAQQLERARSLGVPRPQSDGELEALRREERLVPLEDSTALWVVRELDHSVPLVTPDTRAMLTELGERFQARLEELGLPPLRLEVTSVLRTAATQADLRQQNPNAARGVSTHEFGTTLDIAYSSFAAPQAPGLGDAVTEIPWLREHLNQVMRSVTEAVAARRSRELQAILGRVLREMQEEGKVMVTLERQQPVYHMTVAERY